MIHEAAPITITLTSGNTEPDKGEELNARKSQKLPGKVLSTYTSTKTNPQSMTCIQQLTDVTDLN